MEEIRVRVKDDGATGAHARVSVFVGPKGQGALCGPDLVMRSREAKDFARLVGTEADPGIFEEITHIFSEDLGLDTWHDVGGHFTCSEADSFAFVLDLLELTRAAEAFREGHAECDEQGDAHYVAES